MVHINADMPVTLNYVILAVSYLGGGLGNCAFVLLSGYLLIDKSFSVKRIIRLWFQVLCWSIFCGIIVFALGAHEVNVKTVLSMILFVIEVLSIFGVGIVLDLLREKLLEERMLILFYRTKCENIK